jgi:hypothetical protein
MDRENGKVLQVEPHADLLPERVVMMALYQTEDVAPALQPQGIEILGTTKGTLGHGQLDGTLIVMHHIIGPK